MLLGSDYADGVHGVGKVISMEVVEAWGGNAEGLKRFKTWS